MSKAKTNKIESARSPWNRFIYNNNTVGYIFAAPFIIGFLAFTIIPMLSSLYYSCTNYDLINQEKWVGFKNYINLFKDERFINSVKVTFQYVLYSVPLKLAFALIIAILVFFIIYKFWQPIKSNILNKPQNSRITRSISFK